MTCQPGGRASPLPSFRSPSHTLATGRRGHLWSTLVLWKFPYVLSSMPPLASSLSGLREGLTQDRTLHPQRGLARSCPGPLAPVKGLCSGTVNRPPRDLQCVCVGGGGGRGEDLP